MDPEHQGNMSAADMASDARRGRRHGIRVAFVAVQADWVEGGGGKIPTGTCGRNIAPKGCCRREDDVHKAA